MQINLGRPQPKQALFLKDTHKHVAFGGARGGGKSWSLRYKATLLALNYGGIQIGMVRSTYPELQKNHINPLRTMLCTKAKVATYNDGRKEMRFKNGSIIYFMYCQSDRDAERFSGIEVDVLMIDEATHFKKEHLDKMRACVRGTNEAFPRRIYYTCNPDGESLSYIRRLFIDRIFEDGECPEDYSFIQSLLTDNEILMKNDPTYVRYLESLPPTLKKAWLEGDWHCFEGMFFSEWRDTPDPQKCAEANITPDEARHQHRWTHVIPPFAIPPDWTIHLSYDFGFNKPFSAGVWAVDHDGVAYRILDIYGGTKTPNEGLKWTPQQQFRYIKEILDNHPVTKGKLIHAVADPSIWDGSRGISVEEEASKCGIYFERGVNDRIAGWMQVRERLKFDLNGYAMLYVFESCKSTIRIMPLQMFDEHKPEDCDTDLEDHLPDEVRYFCMSRPIAPREIVEEYKPAYDPLNQFGSPWHGGNR